jgi:hypothetical protein
VPLQPRPSKPILDTTGVQPGKERTRGESSRPEVIAEDAGVTPLLSVEESISAVRRVTPRRRASVSGVSPAVDMHRAVDHPAPPPSRDAGGSHPARLTPPVPVRATRSPSTSLLPSSPWQRVVSSLGARVGNRRPREAHAGKRAWLGVGAVATPSGSQPPLLARVGRRTLRERATVSRLRCGTSFRGGRDALSSGKRGKGESDPKRAGRGARLFMGRTTPVCSSLPGAAYRHPGLPFLPTYTYPNPACSVCGGPILARLRLYRLCTHQRNSRTVYPRVVSECERRLPAWYSRP